MYIVYIQYLERVEVLQLPWGTPWGKGPGPRERKCWFAHCHQQPKWQVKALIISGELQEGDALPSMRLLAKELRISVITTKRAYEELEREGFLYSLTGKGSFVAGKNTEFLKEEQLRKVEEHLQEAVKAAQLCGMEKQELVETLNVLWEE